MFQIFQKTSKDFFEKNCLRMAAALSYYTAFSLAPLLILIITLCGFLWSAEDVQVALEQQIKNLIGSDGAKQIDFMLRTASSGDRGRWGGILSSIFLFVGATGVVGQLQSAMNDAWEVAPDPQLGGFKNFFVKRVLSFAMICAIAFLLLVSLAISSALASTENLVSKIVAEGISEGLIQLANACLSFVIIACLFAGMFKYLPDAEVKWSDVLVGAVMTALMFAVGKFAIGIYLGSRNTSDTYGAAGSLALVMIWIYYSAAIFLYGALFTRSWAKHRGDGIVPSEGAVRMKVTTERVE